jgi:hypothetical protein
LVSSWRTAHGWAAQVGTVQALMAASELAGTTGVPQFLYLEIVGSWQVSQSTAIAGWSRRTGSPLGCRARCSCWRPVRCCAGLAGAGWEAGVERTADQSRADVFAALPAMVLTALQTADQARDSPAQGGELDLEIGGFADVPWTFGPDQVCATVFTDVHVPVSTAAGRRPRPARRARITPRRPGRHLADSAPACRAAVMSSAAWRRGSAPTV